jgi:xanthine dehydrogenase small subunit
MKNMDKNTEKFRLAQVSFWLNGKKMELSVPPGMTVLELLNEKLSLTGTKSSCNEGDCGACTVIIGQKKDRTITYKTVNSCLYPAFRLHGKHLITVEGISAKDELHPVQIALLDEHGTQCGFCTPGFVMSLVGLFLNTSNPTRVDILAALEGNLCRCTGYDSIFKAANLLKKRLQAKVDLLPPALRNVEKQLKTKVSPLTFKPAENNEGWETYDCHCPQSLTELWDTVKACQKTGSYKFIAGGTDLMVLANIQHIHSANLIDLSGIAELDSIRISKKELQMGANVTLADLQQNTAVGKHFPLLVKAIGQMAGTQIRNSATLAGNIANASPVADSATTLLALDAFVIIASNKGERIVRLSEFYHAYKQTELKPDEIIKTVVLPLPSAAKHFYGFLKSAKRKAVDISGVVSALSVSYQKNKITQAVLSLGGVAPYPALALKTMAFLQGKILTESIIRQAADLAQSEFKPISDVRGQKEYRSLLIKNHITRHLTDLKIQMNNAKGRQA